MIKRKQRLIFISIILFFLIFIFISFFGGRGVTNALAESEISYTGVLSDLNKDESFNADDYPAGNADKGIYVIQIAESENDELFVYVYQPYTGSLYDLTATSINISTGIEEDLSYKNYGLTLLSSSGVFHKYKVNGFTVSEDETRYYDISAIYRAYIEGLDGNAVNDNTVSEKSFEVAQQWQAATDEDGSVYYYMIKNEVVVITDKYVGYLEYSSGFFLWEYNACQSHYIAFSTDYDIDRLYEADVYFVTQAHEEEWSFSGLVKSHTYGDEVENTVTLTYTDSVTYKGDWFLAKTYSWDRIQSAEDFISSESLTDEATEAVSGMQWVLRFYETEYSEIKDVGSGYYDKEETLVTDVTILRLKFLCDGKVYNLGVVDNKQTSGDEPDNTNTEEKATFAEWLQDNIYDLLKGLFNFDFSTTGSTVLSIVKILFIMIIAGIIIWLLSLLVPIIKLIFKAIAMPFKAIGKAAKKSASRAEKKQKTKNTVQTNSKSDI